MKELEKVIGQIEREANNIEKVQDRMKLFNQNSHNSKNLEFIL